MSTKLTAGGLELELLGRLRAHLDENNITQRSIAKQLGINEGHFSQLLSGVRPMRIGHLLKIVEITGFAPSLGKKDDDSESGIMRTTQNQDLMRRILGLLYQVDQRKDGSLKRVHDYLVGFVDGLGGDDFKKKIVTQTI